MMSNWFRSPSLSRAARKSKLRIESLEHREVPATLDLTSGVLEYVAGSGINNSLAVSISGSDLVFTDSAEVITTSIAGAVGSGTNTVNVPLAGITGLSLGLGDGSDTIPAGGVVVTTQNVSITNTGTLLTVSGPVTTSSGTIAISVANDLSLGANIGAAATTGTISISANTDGAGAEGISQTAGSIITANTTATAATIVVNTAGGGTGNASIDATAIGSAAGGTLTITSNGGSVLYPGAAALTTGQIGTTNGGSAPTRVLAARDYVFTATGAGSIGTDARPMQTSSFGTDAFNGSTYNLAGGSGGVYLTKWSGVDLTLNSASATGAGSIRVVAANVGGNNMFVNGNVSVQSGNIYLAADDNFEIRGTSIVGGSGFSGTVWIQGNRDQGTAGQPLTMTSTSSIVTSNTTNVPTGARTPATQAVYLDISGDAGTPSPITLGSITTGDGARVVVNAIPNGIAAEAGSIAMASATNLIDAGPTGTIALTAGITATTVANAIGTPGLPIRVAGGTVVASGNFGTVNVIGTAATNMSASVTKTATQTATTNGPAVNLSTTAGVLTINSASSSTAAGPVTLTGAGGVVLSADVGSATTGAITINGAVSGTGNVVTGGGVATFNQDASSTYGGVVSGPQGLTKLGTGNLTTSSAQTFVGPLNINGGTVTLGGNLTGAGGVNIASGNTLTNTTGSVAGPVAVTGQLVPGGLAAGSIGTGNLSFGSGGSLVASLNASGAAGTAYDQVSTNGTVNATNGSLRILVGSSPTLTVGDTFTIVANDAADAITGQFTNGTTVSAADNPLYQFTVNYAGGDGNDIVVTLATVLPPRYLDVTSGTLTYLTGVGINSNVAVSVASGQFTLTDTAGVINLSSAAITAGWTGDGTNAVSGPTAGITSFAIDLADGTDAVSNLNGANANVTVSSFGDLSTSGTLGTSGNLAFANTNNLTLGGTINPTGALSTSGIVTLDLTGAISPGTAATLTAGNITTNATALIAAPAVTIAATNGIGTSGTPVKTAASTVSVNAGAGGAFIVEADGATVTAVTTGTGSLGVASNSGSLNLSATTAAGNLTATSGGSLTIVGTTSTGSGNISLSAANAIALNANVSSTAGTITIAANTDGTGSEGFDQKAATISTGNATPSALAITVNTAGGGTGDAIIGQGTVGNNAGGGIVVNANGGNIVWSNDPIYAAFGASQTGLGNGGSNAQVLRGYTYDFLTGATGGAGTSERPIQIDNFGTNSAPNAVPNLTANVGSGGLYVTGWDSSGNLDLTTGNITAQGAGSVRVVAGNSGGHNLWVAGNITTGTGNILLGADDNLDIVAGVTIGGGSFAGNVWIQANRDLGTAGQTFTMAPTASIVTNSTTNVATTVRTPDTQAVYLDIGGDTGTPSALTVGSITAGNGGRIVLNAIPNGISAEAGRVAMASNTNVLNAGANGTVEVITGITATATADAVGTNALPVRVAGGNAVLNTNYGNVYSVGEAATTFSVTNGALGTQTAAGPVENLSTTAGVLSVNGITNVRSGPVNLTSTGTNGGVAIIGPLADASTGNITINAGTNPATLTTTLSLTNTQSLAVTAANGLEVTGNGVFAGPAAGSNTTPIRATAAGSISPVGNSAGTVNTGNLTIGTGGRLRIDMNNASTADNVNVVGAVDVTGSILNLVVNNTLAVNDAFTIVTNDGADAVTGQFLGGTTINASNDPRYVFTLNYAGGDGNDITATVSQVIASSVLDISPTGIVTLASADALANNLSVAITSGNYSITDTAGVIALSQAAITAGWTGGGTTTVTGPVAGTTGLVFTLNSGADVLGAIDTGATPLAVNGSGTLAVNGLVTSTSSITVGGVTDITRLGSGVLQAPTVNLTASNGIGTAGQRVVTTATQVNASAAAGGVFLSETDGAGFAVSATGAGNVDILNQVGTLNISGLTSTATGNITLSSADAVTLSADVNAGSGTITIAANTDGTGADHYDQKAASLFTTNATANAVSIAVNTAGGGTGDAVLGMGSVGNASGGRISVASNGGNIVWSNDPVFAAFTASQTGLANAGGNVQTLRAYSFNFTTGATGGAGTDARPLQLDNSGANGAVNADPNLTAAVGTGGVFATVWDSFASSDLTTGAISALGDGDIRIVTANSGGHNLFVNGPISTGTGNIYLAADDNMDIQAGAIIGGAGFSGNVWIQGNRDQGTAGQTFLMSPTASIVTSSTTNVVGGPRTPDTQAVYLDISGDAGTPSLLTVSNVTTGNGGRIVLNAIPNTIAAEAGRITTADLANVLDAGATGTVELIAGITATAVADAIGIAAAPIKVAGGNVVVASNFGNTFVTANSATTFNVATTALGTQVAAGPAVSLATTAGTATVANLATLSGAAITLAGTDGVVLATSIGGGNAGAVSVTGALSGTGNIALGSGVLTLTQSTDSTYDGIISGSPGLTKAGPGALTLSAANTYGGGTIVSAGSLLAGNTTGSATGTGNITTADGASLGGSGTVAGNLTVSGSLAPAGAFTSGSIAFDATGVRTVAIDLNGLVAGVSYDQLRVNGTVDLTGSTLSISTGTFRPLLGNNFTVLANDGVESITGTFAGLAQGGTLTVGNRTMTISYIGGDGNDVTLTVTAITAAPPSVTVPALQTTNEDTAVVFNATNGNVLTIDDPDFGGPLQVTLTSTNGVLTLASIANLSFTAGDGTDDATMTFTGVIADIKAALDGLIFEPTLDFSGSASITVAVNDQGGTGGPVQSDSDSVTINVLSSNDAPSFTIGADQSVNEDAAAQTVTGWATSISTGPADESTQTPTFVVTTDNDALFSVLPTVAANGTLTYTVAENAFGSATVTVTLMDDGGTANNGDDTSDPQQFVITVNPVNDVPSFTKGADQTVLEDANAQVLSGWATDILTGPANESSQIVSFNVTTSNDALFSVLPQVSADGTLTYTVAANAFGTATITVSIVDDGGTANGGVDTSASQTFDITVTPVNDAPSFTKGADQTVDEDAGAQSVTGWASSILSGPANESTQDLTFNVTTDNDALFSVLPQIAPNGTLTFTAAANAFGSATVTVTLSDDGGTADGGVDTSASQTFVITINPLNDAPVLTGTAKLAPIPRNIASPEGNLISTVLGTNVSDLDAAALEGIAIIGTTGTVAQGAWQYSIDGGTTWQPLGTASTGAARLLRDTDQVRFVPVAGFIGTVSVTYHAWDQTSGTAGGTVDVSGGTGGTTAFSLATQTATLQVATTFAAVAEDTRSFRGDLVSTILGTTVTDADLKPKSGMAIVGFDNGTAGTWQYSVNGGSAWVTLSNVSTGRALLLRSTDRLRFLPAANASGYGTVEFHAWDQTSGKMGTFVDLTTGTGGGTAYSTVRSIAFAQVTAVNDVPVLDIGGDPRFTRVAPTETDPAGDRVADLLGASVTDVDSTDVGMAITAASGKGTWQFQVNGTSTWTNLGVVTTRAPRFLQPLDRVRFVPQAGITGSARLSYKAWDGTAVSVATESATLLVTTEAAPAPNTAPVLDTLNAINFAPVLEDPKTMLGETVGTLLGQAVSDADGTFQFGVAITGLTNTTGGTWQYSINNGRTWLSIGTVSDANALLLRDVDKLRFMPKKDFVGTATITYAAWDRTRGAAGARANLALGVGGTTPFSVATRSGEFVVLGFNDAPVLNTKPNPVLSPITSTTTDPAGDLVSAILNGNATDVEGDPIGIAVTAATGAGTWQYQETGTSTWTDIGFVLAAAPRFLLPTDRVRFVPNSGVSGTARLSFKAWDGALVSTALETASLVVNSVDDRPVLTAASVRPMTPVAVNDTNSAGDLVSSIIGTSVVDTDPGATIGMAITTAVTTGGTWQVMVNGTTWEALGTVSVKAPRFLRATDRVRFVPNSGFVGTAKLSFKAWDATSINPNGPLAQSLATGSTTVVVNNAPVLQV